MEKTFTHNGTPYRVETVNALWIPRDHRVWELRPALLLTDLNLEKESESNDEIRWCDTCFVVFGFRIPKTNSEFQRLFHAKGVGEYGGDDVHEWDDCLECLNSVQYVD